MCFWLLINGLFKKPSHALLTTTFNCFLNSPNRDLKKLLTPALT